MWPSRASWLRAIRDVVWNRWFGGIQVALGAIAFGRDAVKAWWPRSRIVTLLDSLPALSPTAWLIVAMAILIFFSLKAVAEAEERRRPRLKLTVDDLPLVMPVPAGAGTLKLFRIVVTNDGEEAEAREVRLVVRDCLPKTANFHRSHRLQVTGGSPGKNSTTIPPKGEARFDLASQVLPGQTDFEIWYDQRPAARFVPSGAYWVTVRAEGSGSANAVSEPFDVILYECAGSLSVCQPSDLIAP